MKVPVGLVGGPLEHRAMMVEHDTKWIFISLIEGYANKTVMAQWPHDEAPKSIPKIPRPVVCYRYSTDTPKLLFEFEESWSDVEMIDGEEEAQAGDIILPE